jgi:ATP/maltotriose-dependent transcriptional regulator MalT
MSPARIWERDGTLAAIGQLLSEARESHGGSLFVVGQAGLGKTTMLERAQATAVGHFQVGIGRGDASEATLPFGIVDQALRGLGFKSRLALGVSPARSGLDARAAMSYAALQFLEEAAHPILLLLDDLHWADEDSLGLLSFLCRRIGGLPIAVIGTLRPWPAAALDMAHRIAKDGNATIDQLRPLTESGAAELLSDRAGRRITPSSARRAAGLAAGNPLLLEQVALNIRKGKGIPQVRGDTAAVEAGLLRSAFTGMSADERRYAQAASILGSRFRPAMASAIAELSPAAGDRTLEALCRGGLFKAEGSTLARFAHPMLRQVVYDEVPAPVRSRWHARAFRLLVSAKADPAEAAEHAVRADLAGDPAAVAILAEAGRAALRAGAISRARQRLQAAVEAAGAGAAVDLLMDLGEVLLESGDGQAAATIYRRVLALPTLKKGLRSVAQRMLGRALFIRGAVQDAAAAFDAAVTCALPDDRPNAAEALLDQAFTSWPTGGPALAMPLLERARELATGASPSLRVRADTFWGFTAFVRGDPAGIDAVNGAVKHALANPEADTADFSWSWGTLGTYGNMAKWTERFADATRAYEVGITAAERMGLPVAMAAVTVMHADTCIRTGKLRLALELADQATLLSDLAPERAFWAAITHAYILAEMGRMDECLAWWQRAQALAEPDEASVGRVWLWHVEAVLAMHARETEQACAVFDRLHALVNRLEIEEPCVIPWAGDAITAYLYGGRRDQALAIIARLERVAERLPCRFPRVVVAGARAALAQVNGEAAESARLLDQATTLAGESGMPVLHARTLTRYGGFLRRTGQDRHARPYLAKAVALAETCGADSLAAKAADELKLAGGRQTKRKTRPNELTPAEARVRRLAELGLSNERIAEQLFVSVNTIETHKQHFYQKLGVKSLGELLALARAAPEREPVPSGDGPSRGR